MMKNEGNPAAPVQLLVARISALMEDLEAGDWELVEAFRRSPSTALFDRIMAFRTFPLEEEFRSAVRRLERGSYGRCMLCSEPIGAAEMLESPLVRYCSHCLEAQAARPESAGSRPSAYFVEFSAEGER